MKKSLTIKILKSQTFGWKGLLQLIFLLFFSIASQQVHAQVTVNSVTICKGDANPILTASGGSGSYTWSTGETVNPITVASPSVTTTYTVTDTNAPFTVATATVTVGPVATATPSAQTICSGLPSNAVITLSSNLGSTTSFTWVTAAIKLNGANSGSIAAPGDIIQTLNCFPSNSVGSVTYTITPKDGACTGSPITATILVNPKPTVNTNSGGTNSQTICSGNPSAIDLTSTFSGTKFTWDTAQANTSGALPGLGFDNVSIVQMLYSDAAHGNGLGGGSVIYSIIPTANGCAGNQVDFEVDVTQTPIITNSPMSQTICSGHSTTLVKLTSDMIGTYYDWAATPHLPFLSGYDTIGSINNPHPPGAEMDSIPIQNISNSSNVQKVVTYSITVNGCPGPITEYKVYINPAPHLTGSSEQKVCSGSSTTLVNLTSDAPPATTTFKWSTFVVYPLSGGFLSGRNPTFDNGPTTTIPTQTLTTTSIASDTVVYLITISNSANACKGSAEYWTIVKPLPDVISTPHTSDTICSDSTSFIELSSSLIANTTFAWTVNPSGLLGASNSPFPLVGNNDSIKQTLINNAFVADSAVYSITGTSDGCTGPIYTDTVRVEPTPDVTTLNTATICSDSTTSIVLTSHVAGTTYNWTVVPDPSLTGDFSPGNKDTIIRTLHNPTPAPLTAIYTITPTANGCLGIPYNITLTVNPTPSVTAIPAAQTICSDSTTLIVLTGGVAGTTYSWTVAVSPLVTGALLGSNDSIQQTLTNTDITAGFAIYTITPLANGCPGSPITVTITINPTPVITSTITTQTICSDSTTLVPLQSAVAGTTFAWTVDASGLALGAFPNNNDTIQQQLSNATTTQQTAVYTVTPTASGCPGAPFTVTITVNPTPDASALPSTICSGEVSNVIFSTHVVGTVFNWTVIDSTGVGGALPGSSLTAITQTLTAKGIVAGTATYSVTPTINGCPGIPITVIVTVKPLPNATATNALSTICSGTNTNITLNNDLGAGTTYAWTVSQVGASNTGPSSGTTNPIIETLTATGPVNGTATYTIIPTTNLCDGAPFLDTITVTPIPDIIATPAASTICSGGTTSIALTSLAGSSFTWTVDQVGVSGAISSAGSNITQTLTTTGIAAGTATYSITPSLNGCVGPSFLVVVSVNPLSVTTPASPTICSGTSPNVLLTSTIPGTTFDWTIVQTNVVGARDSVNIPNNGDISQILTATTTSAGSAVYTVTPSASGCSGLPVDVTITVNPLPDVIVSNITSTICSGIAANVVLTSNVAGTLFDWTVVPTGVSGASAVIDTIGPIAQILTSTLTVAGTAVYTITPKMNGCLGTDVTSTVTVNPVSTATPAGQTICTGTAPNIILSSPVLGTTFNWTVVQNGVSGAFDTINSSFIDQVLTLTGLTSGNAVYTITPSANGCAGTAITATVTVDPFDDPSFNYSSSTFCKTDPNPTIPTFIATAGGIFSATPAGLVFISTSTGEINLSASTATVYTVKYVTSGTCPDSSTFGLTITNSPKANFIYSDPFCQNSANPFPGFVGGSSAGVFTTTPGLVFANKFTGEIDLTASSPGTYTVTNTIPPCSIGGAPFVKFSSVTINPIDDATFNYLSSTFCKTGINPTPTFIAKAGGTFSSSPVGLVFVSTSTGEINLSASALKVYSVKYVTNGTCPDSTIFGVTVSNPPVPNFSYPIAAYCKNSTPNPTPTFTVVGSSAGVFTEPTGGLVFANKFTGLIDLTASAAGTYTVTNTIPKCAAGGVFTFTNTVTINAVDDASFNYSSSTFCQSGIDPSPTIAGLAGGTFSSATSGIVFNAVTGQINLLASTLNIGSPYAITYTTNGACPTSSTFGVTITNSSPPGTGFSYAGPYCKNVADPSPTFIPALGASAGVFSAPAGLVFANKFTGLIDLSVSTVGIYTITNTLGCNGATPSTNTVTINPAEDASFNYSYSSFCQGAILNPTPTITGVSGGVFSASPAGIVFVSVSTGQINLSISNVGTYTISYTNVGGTCPNTGTFVVNITNLPSPTASFSYAGPYCQSSTPNASPTFPAGSFPGVFTSSAGLVFSDPFTGLIDLTASAQGTYMVYNTYDCSGTLIKDSSIVIITMFPSFTVPANTDVCDGDAVVTTSFVNIPTYTWTNSNPAIGLAANGVGNVPGFTGTNNTASTLSGLITVTSTLNGCVGSVSSYNISVEPKATANAGADISIISGASITLGGSPTGIAGSHYIWNPSAGFIDNTYANPVTKPTSTTVYTVIVTLGSCKATDSVLVKILPQFAPPGGFTPNSDGVNDTWIVDFLDSYPNNNVEIYNRWGELVFRSPGYTEKWDGNFKGKPLPVGTYYYIIILNDPAFPDAYTGPVTIMR